MNTNSRELFDTLIANMFYNTQYNNYLFYAHIIAQCDIIFSNEVPLCGVSFDKTKYKLWINLEVFETYPINIQMGLMKHEMSHILYNHIARGLRLDPELYNIASDIAINQTINRCDLPKDGCHYNEAPFDFPVNLTSEQYYELLLEDKKNNSDKYKESTCTDGCDNINGKPNHDKWKESEGDPEMMKEKARQILENSIEKSRGNLPNNISIMLEILNRKSQISWQKELKKVLGSKRVNKVNTIKREHRRFDERPDIKGVIKDRQFDLVVILDVSGSMSNNEINYCLTEVKSICKITNSTLNIIQVDNEVKGITNFDKDTKIITRGGCGGTYIEPAITYLRDHKIQFDAFIVLTDGGTESINSWLNPPRRKGFFITTQDDIPGLDNMKRYKQFKLKLKK